jgi:hypothetical protein
MKWTDNTVLKPILSSLFSRKASEKGAVVDGLKDFSVAIYNVMRGMWETFGLTGGPVPVATCEPTSPVSSLPDFSGELSGTSLFKGASKSSMAFVYPVSQKLIGRGKQSYCGDQLNVVSKCRFIFDY